MPRSPRTSAHRRHGKMTMTHGEFTRAAARPRASAVGGASETDLGLHALPERGTSRRVARRGRGSCLTPIPLSAPSVISCKNGRMIHLSRGWAAVGVICCAWAAVGLGCEATGDNGSSPSRTERPPQISSASADAGRIRGTAAYVVAIARAGTDRQRWQLTREYLAGFELSSRPESTAEEKIKVLVKQLGIEAEVWVTRFPSVLGRPEWTASDLAFLGAPVDSQEVSSWHECGEQVRIYRVCSMRQGALARAVLEKLTGIRFTNSSGFWRWFERNKASLRWNASLSRFAWGSGAASKPSGPGLSRYPALQSRPAIAVAADRIGQMRE